MLKHPVALGYTLSTGLILGAFIGYLNSAQQILQEMYALGDRFPLYFAIIALFIGFSSWVNSRLVMHLGMKKLSWIAVSAILAFSVVYLIFAWQYQGEPPLMTLLLYLGGTFFCVGITFGNFNALALEPAEFGAVAGVASAVIGSVSTFIAVPLGGLIGHFYDGTILPLTVGFLLTGLLTLLAMFLTERYRPTDL